jgi:hypothetical protein
MGAVYRSLLQCVTIFHMVKGDCVRTLYIYNNITWSLVCSVVNEWTPFRPREHWWETVASISLVTRVRMHRGYARLVLCEK